MALPVFRAAGAKSEGTGGAVTVAAPAGVATGDLEILISTTVPAGSITVTTPGGSAWTAMTGSPIDVSSGEELFVFWRIRQAGDSDPQVTPGSDHSCSGRLAYQAGTFSTSDPFEIETSSTETTSDTSFSWAPGVSTTDVDRLVLVISTTGADTGTGQIPVCTNAALASLASRANYCTASGGGGGFGCTEGAKAVAGDVGTFACTYAGASRKAYIAFAIKPLAPQTIAVGQATETDTAGVMAHAKSKTLTQPVETDTAGVITPKKVHVVAMGQATETDSATAFTHSKVAHIGQATETDTAQAVDPHKVRAVQIGQAIETDEAGHICPMVPGRSVEILDVTGVTADTLTATADSADTLDATVVDTDTLTPGAVTPDTLTLTADEADTLVVLPFIDC
jgi:hypothetical protein